MRKTELSSSPAGTKPSTHAIGNTSGGRQQHMNLRDVMFRDALNSNRDDVTEKVQRFVGYIRANLWEDETPLRRKVDRMLMRMGRLVEKTVENRKSNTEDSSGLSKAMSDEVSSLTSSEIKKIHKRVDRNISVSRCMLEEKVEAARSRVEALILEMEKDAEAVIHEHHSKVKDDYLESTEDTLNDGAEFLRELDRILDYERIRMEKQMQCLQDDFDKKVEKLRVKLELILNDIRNRCQKFCFDTFGKV